MVLDAKFESTYDLHKGKPTSISLRKSTPGQERGTITETTYVVSFRHPEGMVTNAKRSGTSWSMDSERTMTVEEKSWATSTVHSLIQQVRDAYSK